MKYCLIFFSTVLMACVSNKDYTSVLIKNNSGKAIDSVIIQINDGVIKFRNIPVDKISKDSLSKDQITAKHDVVYKFNVFIKDLKITKTIFSNDLGYIPDQYGIIITDSLSIKEDFTK